jgi:hypothetical protein
MSLKGLNPFACLRFEAVFPGFVACVDAGLRDKALIQELACTPGKISTALWAIR